MKNGGLWHSAQWPLPLKIFSPASSCGVAFSGISWPNTSSFGAGGKSNMFCIWAIIATWAERSGRNTPFLAAVTWSPSKYAVRCSNSVKSSIERSDRFEP